MTRHQRDAVEATDIWLALHTASRVEVPFEKCYARVPLSWALKETRDAFVNRVTVSFSTASNTWANGQPVTRYALYWAANGGDRFHERVSKPPMFVNACCTPYFPPGGLRISKARMSAANIQQMRRLCRLNSGVKRR